MSETPNPSENSSENPSEALAVTPGTELSQWLKQEGLDHEYMGVDHLNVPILKVERDFLLPFASALYYKGFNYLMCQCGYDDGPGADLVSTYHLVKLQDNGSPLEEVRLKVFVPREDPRCPSVFWIWQAADWQERETFDMYGIVYEGHPNLKRILMPEDWVGYPMRKDYVTPDFYELQDAY